MLQIRSIFSLENSFSLKEQLKIIPDIKENIGLKILQSGQILYNKTVNTNF